MKDVTPARLTLVNLANQQELEVQLNPTEFEEALGATYAKHVVPGLSHSRRHFIQTTDPMFKVELFNRAFNTTEMAQIKAARLFLYSALHPKNAESIATGGAPRLIFVWPKLLAVTVSLISLRFRYTHFNQEGHPYAYTASCEFEEDRDQVVTMEDILAQGTIRGNPGGA